MARRIRELTANCSEKSMKIMLDTQKIHVTSTLREKNISAQLFSDAKISRTFGSSLNSLDVVVLNSNSAF